MVGREINAVAILHPIDSSNVPFPDSLAEDTRFGALADSLGALADSLIEDLWKNATIRIAKQGRW